MAVTWPAPSLCPHSSPSSAWHSPSTAVSPPLPPLCGLSLPWSCLSPGIEALALSQTAWHCPDSFYCMSPTSLPRAPAATRGPCLILNFLLGKGLAVSKRKSPGSLIKWQDWSCLCLIWLGSAVCFQQRGLCLRQGADGRSLLSSSESPAWQLHL